MKRILLLFLPFLPYLASAQVAKDTVTVLTPAQITAASPNDTANIYFVIANAWRKANFDSIARYTRNRFQTLTLDSTHIAANGLNLQGTRFTGVLPVTRGGTGNQTGLAATATALATARTIQTNLASTSAASFNGTANITPGVTGQLPVGNGGTGLSTMTAAGHIPYATSATAMTTNSNLTYNGSQLQTNKLILSDATTNYSQIVIENQLNGDARRGGLGVQAFDNLKNVGIFSLISANGLHNINFGGGVSDLYVPTRIWFHTDGYNKTGSSSTTLRVAIDSFGNMGLGTAFNDVISEKLHVVGNVRITAMNGINDIGASATGVLQAATSDYNLKNSIEDSGFGLNHILQLRPVTFLYNDQDRKIHSEIPEVGFIAQDVNDVIPNAVSPTGEGTLQLDYRAITATLVKAIQEQQAQIEQLKQRITQLENK